MLPIHHRFIDDHIYLDYVLKMQNVLAEDAQANKDMYHLMKYSLLEDQRSKLDFTFNFLHSTSILVDLFLDMRHLSSDTRVSNLIYFSRWFEEWGKKTVQCGKDLCCTIVGFISMLKK